MSGPLYRGYSRVANTGVHTELYDVDLVKQDLLNQFMTRIGEAVGRPTYGRIIHDLLFNLSDPRTESLCYADAQRILRQDPRVIPLDIKVRADLDVGRITIRITLRVIEFNMDTNLDVVFRERN